jgi:hypothetical protein
MSGASHLFLATSQTRRPIGGAARSGRRFVARSGDNAAAMGVTHAVCGARAAEIATKGQQDRAADAGVLEALAVRAKRELAVRAKREVSTA